jgi:hypothetical protein
MTRVRFHLLTALILLIGTGFFMWLNLVPEHPRLPFGPERRGWPFPWAETYSSGDYYLWASLLPDILVAFFGLSVSVALAEHERFAQKFNLGIRSAFFLAAIGAILIFLNTSGVSVSNSATEREEYGFPIRGAFTLAWSDMGPSAVIEPAKFIVDVAVFCGVLAALFAAMRRLSRPTHDACSGPSPLNGAR